MHSVALILTLFGAGPTGSGNWYESSLFLLHEDHHTQGQFEVGRDAGLEKTSRLVGLCKPDVIQIHAKGNPGWTTYPTKIGFAPPQLARDVLAVWRDVARRDGYHFSAYYNIGRDGEIMTRHPAWNRVRADGTPAERALCYHSGVAEDYLWPMIGEIIEGYHPDGFWFDGSCFTVQPCYCEACRARFQWERGLTPPKRPDERGWADYQAMQRQIYREFVGRTVERIHRLAPKCLVAVNWAYSLRMPEEPPEGIAYLTGDIGNRVEGLSPEAHWYDSQARPFDLMTTVFTFEGGAKGPPRMVPKPAGQIEQEMAVIVANGGRYFAWDTPSPTSGLTSDRFELMAKVVGPFLRARQPWCLGSKRLPDVSLLHSAAAHYAASDAAGASFLRRDNRIDGATAALARLHLNYEVISDARLAAGDVRSPLLVVEHPKVLGRETAEAVARFVEQGGAVLWSGMGVRGARLESLFGLRVAKSPNGPESLKARLGESELPFHHWLYHVDCAGAEPLVAVIGADGEERALLTCNRAGRGRAYYVSVPLMTLHGKNAAVPPPLVEEVFARALPRAERLLTTTAAENVEIVLRQKGSESIVHLVNLAEGEREPVMAGIHRHVKISKIPRAPACAVSVRLAKKPAAVHLQPEGRRLTDWHWANGRLELRLPGFPIHQMAVIWE